jgi:hypothetical protein
MQSSAAGDEAMWQAEVLTPEDRIAALKAIVQYLVGSRKLTLAKIVDYYPEVKSEQRSELEATLRGFIRLNATPRHTERKVLTGLSQALRHLVRDNDIPHFLRSVAEAAGVAISSRDRPEGVPSFVDFEQLPTAAGTIEQNKELIKAYEGCWRVYRLSSTTDETNLKFNRGFLNIKPYEVLAAQNLSSPEFSLYQRHEPRGGVNRPSKIFGVMLQTNDFVTLLGERAKIGLGMAYVGMLTWLNRGPEDTPDHVSEFQGLSLIPNAEGGYIGAYFIATFIRGSEKYTALEFLNKKREELDSVRSYALEEFERLGDRDAIEAADSLSNYKAGRPFLAV